MMIPEASPAAARSATSSASGSPGTSSTTNHASVATAAPAKYSGLRAFIRSDSAPASGPPTPHASSVSEHRPAAAAVVSP